MCSNNSQSGNAVSILLTVVRRSRTEMAQCDFIYQLKGKISMKITLKVIKIQLN